MIGLLTRAWGNLIGTGEAAVTVPALDGALRPNRLLDEAPQRLPLEGVDSLAVLGGSLYAAAGEAIHVLEAGTAWRSHRSFAAPVNALASVGDGLAVALEGGRIEIIGGSRDGWSHGPEARLACITAMAFRDGALYVANGSARHGPDAWQRDLLERGASGSIWRIDLEKSAGTRIADGLAYPAGLAVDADGIVVAEAWKHRIIRLAASGAGRPQVLHGDLPGYPGRIAAAGEGHWLSVFAPRNQLVEFVLREPGYRKRMLAEIPRTSWVAPTLRSGRSFYEPLQGGSVKHLGMLKPWAPTLSAGLCIRLDEAFQPAFSLHSRADGATHGITSAVEHDGRLWAASRGDGVVIAIPLDELGERP